MLIAVKAGAHALRHQSEAFEKRLNSLGSRAASQRCEPDYAKRGDTSEPSRRLRHCRERHRKVGLIRGIECTEVIRVIVAPFIGRTGGATRRGRKGERSVRPGGEAKL